MDWVGLAKAALLGVIQGFTEFLPVSSTAHLLIAQRLMGEIDPVFTVMIQLGSILAVMWLYRAKIWDTVVGLPSKPDARRFALMVFLAFLPAVAIGLLAADFVKQVLYESFQVIAIAFILGGVAMLLLERFRPTPTVHSAETTPVGRAIGVGVFQTLALIPGVSRSGATILGGLALGLDRRAAAEFSFFLAMPTMTAAFVHDLADVYGSLSPARGAHIAVGFVMAFVSALVVVRPFLNFVTKVGFGPFAWYRIGAGALLLALLGAGRL